MTSCQPPGSLSLIPPLVCFAAVADRILIVPPARSNIRRRFAWRDLRPNTCRRKLALASAVWPQLLFTNEGLMTRTPMARTMAMARMMLMARTMERMMAMVMAGMMA